MNRQWLLQGCSCKYPGENILEKTTVPDPGVVYRLLVDAGVWAH